MNGPANATTKRSNKRLKEWNKLFSLDELICNIVFILMVPVCED